MTDRKTAVIGAGFMGPAHTEALRRLGIPVAGILGADRAESESAAKKLGIPRAYGSYREVLEDDVLAVHLTTPNKFHFAMAKEALEAGKHVLCEKPLAMTSAETAVLVELARKTGLAAAVNYNMRFYPLAVEARDGSGPANSARSIPSWAAMCRTGCSIRPITTGACWPGKAGRCGRSGTSARTGWTWSSTSPA